MAILREVRTEVICDICGECVIRWKSTGVGVSKAHAEYYAREKGCTTGKKVICKSCRISRRIEECSLQKRYGKARKDGSGLCLGFGKSFDDEPIEQCKHCIACTSFPWDEDQ